jgi:hypothetical protein
MAAKVKGTIIVRLSGGLGTQMFQYAFGRRIAIDTGFTLKLDIDNAPLYSLDCFILEQNISDKLEAMKIKHSIGGKHIKEKSLMYDPELAMSIIKSAYIEGMWQNEAYFTTRAVAIHNDFLFKREPIDLNKILADDMYTTNSVAIHVRRGDFVSDVRKNALRGVCSLDYYKQAIQHIQKVVKDPHFFIFTDDPEWVIENMDVPDPAVLISHNETRPQNDLFLMTVCKYFIIANSAFSWWGAWLSDYGGKIVIAPKQWYQNEEINRQFELPRLWVRL